MTDMQKRDLLVAALAKAQTARIILCDAASLFGEALGADAAVTKYLHEATAATGSLVEVGFTRLHPSAPPEEGR